MTTFNRRSFLGLSSALALGAAQGTRSRIKRLGSNPLRKYEKTVSPNEKVILGVVGVGGRGSHHINWFSAHKDVEIAAVCDVYDKHLETAVKRTYNKAKPYKDFRDLVEQKDLDAVIVATPPHWHPLVTIAALEAGKDVYCEKPMCLSPAEGRAMVEAARRNKAVTQLGTQIHAGENYHRSVEIVRSGILGDISMVRTQLDLNEAPDGIGFVPDSDPPKGLDWDMWCGPIEKVPYNEARFVHGQHRYFADTIGSWLHEMGAHIMELPFWALSPGEPKSVVATGGKFAINDMSTIPDTLEVAWAYDDYTLTWTNMCANSHGLAFQRENHDITRRLGTSFHGVNGTLLADYDTYELVSEADRLDDAELPEPSLPRSPGHHREFLNCIKTREQCSCNFAYHYPLHVAMNLGNIAYKVGRKLTWDAEKGEVVGDPEANALANPTYRSPWKLPV